ncbi:response regulator [Iodobacter sp. HSC-16F04]|uniref:Response regulator n=1 Tax=Iodobacter violaceini TaxID=3044271 RepID=A0ABX0KZ00_9NEIS|nr:response regulator [Iodobacter violacea]NHQ87630.1 response regulator [Iodobacter violacea]
MTDLISNARALIADDAPTVRQSLRMTLAQVGITRVDTSSSVGETRRRLRNAEYDVILCDYDFGEGMNGQELLEEIRRNGELPLSTVWFMITAEASYEKVVAVAEVGPDDYLIKPFSGSQLIDRLNIAWKKKKALQVIYDCIAEDNMQGAIEAARGLLAKPEVPYKSDLLRLLSTLLLETNQLEEARILFEEILASRLVPWAKLGLAKVYNKQGNKTKADQLLQASIVQHSQYVDAYEELANMYMNEGRLDEAMVVFDKCLAITPNNINRLQKAGNLANMLGDSAKAKTLLSRAVNCGGNSTALSANTILQLAIAAKIEDSLADAEKYLRMVQERVRKDDSHQNRISAQLASAIFSGKTEDLSKIETAMTDDDFSMELAISFIMTAHLICPPSNETETANSSAPPYRWLSILSKRFVTTKNMSGILESTANQRPAWKQFIQTTGQEITDVNNTGVQLMLKSRFDEAVALLVPEAQNTRNSRLTLSAAHASVKYLKADAPAEMRPALLKTANELISRLRGHVDESVYLSLRNDLDELLSPPEKPGKETTE